MMGRPRILNYRPSMTVERLLKDRIAAGARAPTQFEMWSLCGPGFQAQLLTLRKSGRLRIGVYGKNYRVIWLDGASTALPPFPNTGPYRMLDASGDRWLTHELEAASARGGNHG